MRRARLYPFILAHGVFFTFFYGYENGRPRNIFLSQGIYVHCRASYKKSNRQDNTCRCHALTVVQRCLFVLFKSNFQNDVKIQIFWSSSYETFSPSVQYFKQNILPFNPLIELSQVLLSSLRWERFEIFFLHFSCFFLFFHKNSPFMAPRPQIKEDRKSQISQLLVKKYFLYI